VAGDLDRVVSKVRAVVGDVSTMVICVIAVARHVLLVVNKVLPWWAICEECQVKSSTVEGLASID
jgi:hypothetical protein